MAGSNEGTEVTVLGLGEMGRALAAALVDEGHATTVWNRSPGKAAALADRGAAVANTIEEAVIASPLLVACLLDHGSVHEVLDPLGDRLRGRALINVTTASPQQAQELASWAADNGVDYLDGGIMAVPDMIGQPVASILYSGSPAVFEEHEALLDLWGQSSYLGPDPGTASLYDLAILAGMYMLFAGFFHGAAMVGSEGGSATDFAATPRPRSWPP